MRLQFLQCRGVPSSVRIVPLSACWFVQIRGEIFLVKCLSLNCFFAPNSPARKVHFFENFNDFSPIENFFELSTSYQQCEFFDAVF